MVRKAGSFSGVLPARQGGQTGRGLLSRLLLSAAGLALAWPAYANPEGGTVTAGQATISSVDKLLEVNQSSQRAVIDWRSFDIAPDETTRFVQPNSAAITLNRVNSTSRSVIEGQLKANGNLVVINPNGVFFSHAAVVDVGGLVATSADIGNDQFMAGSTSFDKPGAATATVRNDGRITASEAGLVGLVAPNVENNGQISARLGRVALAAGDTATIDFQGDGLIQVAVSDEVAHQLVSQQGGIDAQGGTIQLTAAAGRHLVDNLVQAGGTLDVSATSGDGGSIVIGGGDAATSVTGALTADGDRGGHVMITGDSVHLTSTASVSATGRTGGGTVLVGGDYQGSNPEVSNARVSQVDAGAEIAVDATENGDGGKAIIWADDVTRFAGDISARGGAQGGDGGFVEVSGKRYLTFAGHVDTLAPLGAVGQLLLDPTDIVIANGSGDSAADGTATFAGTPSGAAGTVTGGDTGPTTLYESELQGIAATTNISLTATNSITINDLADNNLNFAQNGGRSVTLSAGAGGITMADTADTLTTAGGALNITTTGGGVATLGNLATAGGLITLNLTGASTVAGNITGTGTGLTLSGAGTITLSGTNTYTGTTTITAGALQIASAGNIGSGTISLNGGTLQGTGAAISLANAVSLANSSTIAGSSALTFNGVFTHTRAGNSTLTNNSTDTLTLAGNVNLSNSATSRTVTVAGTGTTTISGNIANGSTSTTSALTKTGTGTLTLSGANTYGGTTTLTAGTLAVDGASVLGTGTLSLNGGTLQAATSARTISNTVSIAASSTLAGSQDLTFSGSVGGTTSVTLTNNSTGAVTFNNMSISSSATNRTLTFAGTGSTTVNGTVSNGGTSTASGITKSGTGTLTLNGASTYAGTTTVSAGTLRVTNSAGLGTGTLSLNGGTLQLASDTSTSFSNNTTLAASSTVTVDRLTSGAAVTHTLGTLSSGSFTLTVNAGSNIASGTVGLVFGAATLTGNATLSVASASALTLGALTDGGTARTMTKSGAGDLVLSAAAASWATASDALVVNDGTVRLAASNAFGTGSNTNVTVRSNVAGGTALLDLNGYDQSIGTLTFGGTGGTSTSTSNVSTGAGTLTLGGNVTFTNTGNPLGSTVSGKLNLGAATRTFNIGDSTNATNDLTIDAIISGTAVGMTKATGTGTLLITGSNTYTGTTTVSAGTLATTNGSAFGTGGLSLGGGTLALYSDTALSLGNAVTVTASTAITSGRATSGAALTHTLGTLAMGNQTLTVNAGSNIASGTAGIAFGATTFSNSPTFSVGSGALVSLGALTDGGTARTITKSGAGILAFSAAAASWATASDALTINNGTVRLDAGNAFGTGTNTNVTVNATVAGATALLDLNGFNQSIGTLTFGGTGGTSTSTSNVATGAGTLTLGGNLTLSATGNPLGSTISGKLDLGAATRTFNIADSTNAAADLTVDAVISGTAVGLTKATGTGTLVLNGANTFTGIATLSAGTLRATQAAALGAGTLTLSGGTLQLAADSDTNFARNTTISASTTVQVDRLTAGAAVSHTLGTLSQSNVTLTLSPGSQVSSGTAALTFGGTTFTNGPTFSIASGAQLNLGALTDGGAARAVTKTGAGLLNLTATAASWAAADTLTINNGTVRLGAINALGTGTTTAVTVNANVASATALFDLNGNNQGVLSLTFGGTGATSTSTNNVTTGAGTLTLGGNVTYTSTNNPLGATLGGNLDLGGATRTFTVNDSASASSDLTVSAIISNSAGGLTKAGAGTLVLSGNNTYTGTTTVSAGSLAAGHDNAFGASTLSLNGGTLAADGAARTLANSVSLAASSTIGGSLALALNGAMTNTLAGSPTLTVNNSALTTLGAIALSNSATSRTLTIAGSGDVAITGAITNGGTSTAGALTLNSTGMLTLSGASTYGGATTITAGTLQLGASNVLPNTTALSVAAAGAVDFNGYSDTLASVSASGSTAFGTGGTITTSGAQSYTGVAGGGSVTLASTGGGAISAANTSNDFTGTVAASTTGAVTLYDANNLTLGAVSGNTVAVQAGTDLTLSGTVTGTATTGTPVTLIVGGVFTNSAGASALQTGVGGRWLVYSQDPADDSTGSLSPAFIRYSCTYGGSCPSFPAGGDGLLYSVTPVLTITPSAASAITYGDAAPGLTGYAYTVSGYLGGDAGNDSRTGSLTGTTTYTQGSNAGTYDISYSSGTLTSAMGYGFTYASNASGLTVGKRTLGAVVQDQTITYGTARPALDKDNIADVQWSNFYTGDDSTDITSAAFSYGGAGVAPNAATYTLGLSSITSTNYTLGTVTTGQLTVNPYTLSVTANNLSKTYGAADPALTYSYGTLQNGDTASVFSGALTRAAGETVAGGPYAITQGTLGAGSNYSISFTAGQLTINPYVLAVMASNQSKLVGDTDPALTYTYGTLQNGDTASVFSGALTRAAGETVAGGPYAITQGTLGAGSNYSINFTAGQLLINAQAGTTSSEPPVPAGVQQELQYIPLPPVMEIGFEPASSDLVTVLDDLSDAGIGLDPQSGSTACSENERDSGNVNCR